LKLATYRDGSSDGQLVVVSRDLSMAHYATGIASRLQSVLDDWNFIAPQLEDLSTQLQSGRSRHAFAFEPGRCMAPLPRPGLHVQGNAYPSHSDVLRRAAAVATREAQSETIRLCAAPSGDFLGACADIVLPADAEDIDCAAGLAVVTGALPAGTSADRAIDGIRLLMLTHSIELRALMSSAEQLGHVCAAIPGQPAVACAPVAVTPDELGTAWQEGRVNLAMQSLQNGRRVGRCEAGTGMRFHFGQLLAQLARYRSVPAGTVVGGGTLSNPPEEKAAVGDSNQEAGKAASAPASPHWPRGAHCVAERRAIETLLDGAPRSPWLRTGDRLRSEMKAADGHSVFGAIDHVIALVE
jgi:fumarylacetoacetate (FAA) hydrolase